MIYIVEGVDGTGKSTLANEIAKQKDAAILHSSFNKKWNMQSYHASLILCAENMNDDGISVVLDRWAPSEKVYGIVFRNGESYNTDSLIRYYYPMLPIVWIYCKNDNAVVNHLKNKKNRHEMFDNIEDLVPEFDGYIQDHKWMNWIIYDFNKIDIKEFVKELS